MFFCKYWNNLGVPKPVTKLMLQLQICLFLLCSCLIQVWRRKQWEWGWSQWRESETGVEQLLQEADESAQSELVSLGKKFTDYLLW